MKPETAMRQASMTAMDYTGACLDYIKKLNLNLSDEAKLQCATRMALAASIDFATAVFSGSVDGYAGLEVSDKRDKFLKDIYEQHD